MVTKTRGSEWALREEKQGPHQCVTNHKCRAPQGALLRRKRTPVENKIKRFQRRAFHPRPSTTPRGSNAGFAPARQRNIYPRSTTTPGGSLPGLHRPGNKRNFPPCPMPPNRAEGLPTGLPRPGKKNTKGTINNNEHPGAVSEVKPGDTPSKGVHNIK